VDQETSPTNERPSFFSSLWRKRSAKVGLAILVAYGVVAFVGPLIVRYSPYDVTGVPNSPPSLSHPFGTEFLGRDVFSQTISGLYLSLPIGIATATAATLLGFVVGILAGYFDRLEGILIGAADVLMVFPALPLMVLLGSIFPATDFNISLIMVLVLWPPIARSIRSQALSVKKRPFVDAAKTVGMSDLRVIRRVIAPEVASIAFAYFVLTVAASIVLVSALQFLGVGNPDVVSWGSMLYFAQQFGFYAGDWWWIMAPGLSITTLAVALALIGFSFEELMNPRLRA
jgi:peptide/nickel transport system permease protein